MKKTFVILFIVNVTNLIFAQKEDTTYKYWITLGGWVDRNASLNLNYNFSLSNNFYKVGYFIRGGFSQSPSVGEDGYLFNTIDVSVGKRFQSEWFQASIFAGPSYTYGEKRISQGNNEYYNTVVLKVMYSCYSDLQTELELDYMVI